MSDDDSKRRILSRKELAKEQRREAYQKAKERRAADPRFIAMKEAAKEQRRAAYQKVKQQRKASTDKLKADHKAERIAQRDAQHPTQRSAQRPTQGAEVPPDEDPQLPLSVAWLSKGSTARN